MHHNAGIVHQHPAGFGGSFATTWFGITGFERIFFDTIGNRFQLPFARGSADDEVIYMWRQFAQIEQDNVFALFALNGVDNLMCEF